MVRSCRTKNRPLTWRVRLPGFPFTCPCGFPRQSRGTTDKGGATFRPARPGRVFTSRSLLPVCQWSAGPLLSSLQQQLEGRPQVRFLGWRSSAEIAQALSQADIYLSLSDTESYSLTASEALACGVPVIAPRALAFERLDGLGVGLLFPPNWLSSSGMRRLADSLLELAPRVPAWSNAARRLAPSLSWDLALGRLFADLSARLKLTI